MEDFEKKIKDSQEVIEPSRVNNSDAIYQKSQESVKIKRSLKEIVNLKLVVKFAILLLFVGLVFFSGVFVSNALREKNNKGNFDVERVTKSNQETPLSFGSFESEEQLISYLSNNMTNQSQGGSGWFLMGGDEAIQSNSSPTVASPAPKTSDIKVNENLEYQTNTQVENVDEADVVKVHGKNIFYLPNAGSYYSASSNNLYMFTETNGKLKLVKTINYGYNIETIKEYDDTYSEVKVTSKIALDLYVTDKYLVVHVGYEAYTALQTKGNSSLRSYYDHTYRNVFEIYNIDDLEFMTTIETAGSNVSTRLIGNTLYVVNNYNDYYRSNIKSLYRPYIFIGTKEMPISFDAIYYCIDNEINAKTYVSIYKITLDDKIKNDCYYADHISFLLDMKIFFKTIMSVMKHENVFVESSESNKE